MTKQASKFLRVICPECSKEQVIFGKAASRIKCNSCNKLIAKPSGGKTIVMAKVKEGL
jgi:small subunit ribosomal protein S27e